MPLYVVTAKKFENKIDGEVSEFVAGVYTHIRTAERVKQYYEILDHTPYEYVCRIATLEKELDVLPYSWDAEDRIAAALKRREEHYANLQKVNEMAGRRRRIALEVTRANPGRTEFELTDEIHAACLRDGCAREQQHIWSPGFRDYQRIDN